MIALLAVLLAGTAPSPQPLHIRSAEFVAERFRDDGSSEVVATRRIPYVPERSCYHWLLRVEPRQGMAKIREVFELPAAAKHWGTSPATPGEQTKVDPSQAGAVTQLEDSPEDGIITHGWCVAAGDPVGHYRIRVYEGRTLLHTFEFDVVLEEVQRRPAFAPGSG